MWLELIALLFCYEARMPPSINTSELIERRLSEVTTKPDKILAGKAVIDALLSCRNNKMGSNETADSLLESYLEYGPWVRNIGDISLLQASNMITYINTHDEEQIVRHIMDLNPRVWQC